MKKNYCKNNYQSMTHIHVKYANVCAVVNKKDGRNFLLTVETQKCCITHLILIIKLNRAVC